MVAHLSFNHIRQRFAFVRTPLKYFFSGSSNVHDSFTLASLQNDSIDIDNQSGAIAEYETGEEPLLGLFETYFVSAPNFDPYVASPVYDAITLLS